MATRAESKMSLASPESSLIDRTVATKMTYISNTESSTSNHSAFQMDAFDYGCQCQEGRRRGEV